MLLVKELLPWVFLVKFYYTNKKWEKQMKPKATVHQAQRELCRIEFEGLVDAVHALVKLSRQMNWAVFDEQLGRRRTTRATGRQGGARG